MNRERGIRISAKDIKLPEKIPALAQGMVNRATQEAEGFCSEFDLYEKLRLPRLGLERLVFRDNLGIRIIKTDIYDNSFLLHRPVAIVMYKIPGLSKLIKSIDNLDRNSRMAEEHMRQNLNSLTSMVSERDKAVFRTLELAANDLIYRSTINKKHKTDIILEQDTVQNWFPRWREEIKTKRISRLFE